MSLHEKGVVGGIVVFGKSWSQMGAGEEGNNFSKNLIVTAARTILFNQTSYLKYADSLVVCKVSVFPALIQLLQPQGASYFR